MSARSLWVGVRPTDARGASRRDRESRSPVPHLRSRSRLASGETDPALLCRRRLMRRSVHPILRRLGASLAIGAALVGTSAAGMMTAAAAVTATPPDGYAVSINQGNVPTNAADFNGHSCDEFGSKAATDDGWLFVASPDDFTSFEAVFDQGKVFYNDPGSQTSTTATSVAFPKPNEHLAVTTPAGWRLLNAYANLADKKGGA